MYSAHSCLDVLVTFPITCTDDPVLVPLLGAAPTLSSGNFAPYCSVVLWCSILNRTMFHYRFLKG